VRLRGGGSLKKIDPSLVSLARLTKCDKKSMPQVLRSTQPKSHQLQEE
jgi:hypothetical protein